MKGTSILDQIGHGSKPEVAPLRFRILGLGPTGSGAEGAGAIES